MEKKNYNKNVILYFKFIIIILNLFLKFKYSNNFQKINNNLYKNNSYECFIPDKLYFNISLIRYSYSLRFNIVKLEYNIAFFDEKNNLIIPSFLTLFYKLHIFCQTININIKVSIKYIANIFKNKFYNCIEYSKINQSDIYGISIYKTNKYTEYFTKYYYNNNLIDYNNIDFKKDNEFEPLIQIKKYGNLKKKIIENNINQNNKNESLLLKSSFYSNPKFIFKYHLPRKKNIWEFQNIYNEYFCFCKDSNDSKCFYKYINIKCKYNSYLNIIDNNRNLYKKTDYLFSDFSSSNTSPGEAYLIFKEMLRQNLSVHYMSKREDIYKKYQNFDSNITIPIIFDWAYINGDFLEKYLDLFLKLKAVISGAKIFSVNNIFYNIEYITYICLGHGISYLKDFLYKDYYSNKIYNKILLPPSQIIISNAKKYGWNDENIIRIGLPRWDYFTKNENKSISFSLNNFKNEKSIFAMFSWRSLKKNQTISKYYFKNILKLINNKTLIKVLKKNNIIFYYTLHHMIEKYKILFQINPFIIYIEQEEISKCLKNSQLIITDFSSIIFDMMVRKKPYIIFIPDSDEPNLNIIYTKNYYNLINDLIKGNINFENRFFNIEGVITKIIYYINNKFELETKLKKFYDSFQLEVYNNTQKCINYLLNLS